MNLTHEGWLAKDSETKMSQNGKPIVSFSMAFNPGKKEDKKPAIWFNFKAVGEAGTTLDGTMKDDKVSVVRAMPEEWTAKDGSKRTTWVVFEAEVTDRSTPKKYTQEASPVDDDQYSVPF